LGRLETNRKKTTILIITLIIASSFGSINVSSESKNIVSIETDTNTWSFNSSWDTWECNSNSTGNAISEAYVNSTIGIIYGQPKVNETGGGHAEGWMGHSVEWDCPVDNESGVINISYEYGAFAFLRVNSSGYAHTKLWLTFFIDDMQHEVIIYNNTINEIETVNFSADSIVNWSKNLTLSNKTYTIGVNASYEIEYTGNDTQSIAWLSINIPDTTTEEGDGETEYWAVLIGVDYAWDEEFETHFPFDEDAEGMYKILLVSDHWHWQEDHIKVLTNEEATWIKIIDALLWLDSKDDEDDISLVYYTAHGGSFHNFGIFGDIDFPPKDEEDGYDEFLSTYWTAKRLFAPMTDDLFNFLLDRLDSEGVAVIIESCHSGGMIDSPTWITEFSGEISQDGRVIVTSCGEHELGYVESGVTFNDYMSPGLQGSADDLSEGGNDDGVVSIEEAFTYAGPRYINLTGNKSHPECDDRYPGELVITDVDLPPSIPILYVDDVTIGQPGTSYFFNASSTDPENNTIRYGWNWSKDVFFGIDLLGEFYGWGGFGVGNWSGYYSSGENCTMQHTWNDPGVYAVRVKAQDEHGAERTENCHYVGLWSKPKHFLINAEDEIPDQYLLAAIRTKHLYTGLAQSFKPNSGYLSKIKLKLVLSAHYDYWIDEEQVIEYPLKISIREDLNGENLIEVLKKASTELKKDLAGWVEFDFPDIKVTPDKPYYIVIECDTEKPIYHWTSNKMSQYPRGNAYFNFDGSWENYSHIDFCFITYEPWPVDAGGPYYALLDEQPVQFNGSAFGNPPYNWSWDFGDGNISYEEDPIHNYTEVGNYTVKLSVNDSENITTNDTTWANIRDFNNPPYAPKKPSGPTICKIGKYYDYSTNATDPDGDPLYYKWDWGDGTYSEWLGPVPSGQTHVAYHSWSQWGLYKIRVKAKDVYGGESNWSEEKWVYVRLLSGFSVSPSAYSQPSQTVYFNDQSKSYYNIVSWTWDFGDGNFSYAQNTSHTYGADGVYTVTLTVTDSMSFSNVSSQLVYIDSVQPGITSITDTPDTTVGFGFNVTIRANVTDNISGVDTVKVNISYPDGSSGNYTMSPPTSLKNPYEYVFNDAWLVGQYNYTIWAKDKASNGNSSSGYSFNVSAQANISVCTVKDEYGDNEYVNLTDPPSGGGDNQQMGYELIDNNTVLHIWNEYNSYYFNTSSGIQLTNHYDEYWSHNVLMLGYYNNDEWNLLYRTDQLTGFNKDIDTDDETYVNATLWKDLTHNGYDFRLAIRYHLKVNDYDLTIIPYIKNLGQAIPYDLGFGWEINDIKIANTTKDNYLQIYNGSGFEKIRLNQTLDRNFTNMDFNTTIKLICTNPPTHHLSRSLYLSWDRNLTYKVTVKSRSNQYNAPTTLFIRVGTLDVGQEKFTMMHWLDSDDWLGIDSSHYHDHCGDYEEIGYRLIDALDGIGMWIHDYGENHWFILDLGQTYTITKVRGRSADDWDPVDCAVYVTEDTGYWGSPVATGISTWQDTLEWQEVSEFEKVGRYVKVLIIETEYGVHGPITFGYWDDPITIFDVYGEAVVPPNNAPTQSNQKIWNVTTKTEKTLNATSVGLYPTSFNITINDLDGDNMTIVILTNESGSWTVVNEFGSNGLSNGTYSFTNTSWIDSYSTTYYISSNLTDGTDWTNETYHFTTYIQSKIENTGSTDIKGYLLMQVQYYNETAEEWVVADDTVNETNPRIINSSDQFGLDTVFNGEVNTNDLSEFGSGSGTYRVYAAFRDPDGNILKCDDETLLVATYEFNITFS